MVRSNDLLIFYVGGGVSSLSGVRKVDVDGVAELRRSPDYDLLCPAIISTVPLVSVPRERWIKIKPLVGKLKLFGGHANWGNVLRRAVIPLEASDAALIIRTMSQAVPDPGWRGILDSL